MPGGLIQIVNYGTQDLTLTGNPQITFFNIVFRRYTNFGKINLEMPFDNPVNFNTTSTITLSKNGGDLLSNLTLKIILPALDITQLIQNLNLTQNANTKYDENYILYYNYFLNFYNNIKNIVDTYFAQFDIISSGSYISNLSIFIKKYINNDQIIQFKNAVDYFYIIKNQTTSINTSIFTNACLFNIKSDNNITYNYANLLESTISYDNFKNLIYKNMNILNDLNNILYTKLQTIINPSNYLQISWINKIGIYLINSIEFFIGTNKISSMSDYYINNYGDITYKNKDLYNNIIGNNIDINTPSITKDAYELYLPLPLWFTNNYGLSFPLISLQFNNIQIKINFKTFIECIKIDIGDTISNDSIKSQIKKYIISNYNEILKSPLNISVIGEYIFLDGPERKKFAQTSHEYLISQVQEIDFTNITNNNMSFNLDFFHCCKDICWFPVKQKNLNDIFNKIVPYSYQINTDNTTYTNDEILLIKYYKILYDPSTLFNRNDYILGLAVANNIYNNNIISPIDVQHILENEIFTTVSTFTKYQNIITQSAMYLNGTALIAENTNYFNYLQPYNYYKSTPSNGFSIYSFSLSPTENQPTGACNFSIIPNIDLKININENILEKYDLVVHATNYNILRIIGGIAGTAYTY
jgi:hypothetical protein